MHLDHVQLPMPPGGEDEADAFYRDLLGLTPVAKPENLAVRGGRWYGVGALQIHLGVDPAHAPSTTAHVCFVTHDYDALHRRLVDEGCAPVVDTRLATIQRFYCTDPFGNRIEIQEGPDATDVDR